MNVNKMVLELVDEYGERKYVKQHWMERASEFLLEKGKYHLA